MSASVASSPAKYTLFSVFVPNLGIGATVAGIDLGAGLRAVANVDPELSLQGPITAQVRHMRSHVHAAALLCVVCAFVAPTQLNI